MTRLRVHGWILLLLVIGLARGLLYARVAPLWQGPDEPRHYEYARLMGQLGRVPTRGDANPQVEQEILRSLREHRFWALTGQPTPEPLPGHLADDPWLNNAGPQIGGESPLYYAIPALLTIAFSDIESQARALRIYSVSLYTLTILAIALGSHACFRRDALLRKGLPLFVALAPMPTFVGSIINNDALANLAAATFFAVLATTWPRRWRLPQIGALLLSLAIAVLTKRTCWFLAPTAAFACYIHEPGWRPGELLRRPVVRRVLIVALSVAVGVTLATAWHNPSSPAGWRLNPERAAAPRLGGTAHNGAALGGTAHGGTAHGGSYSLLVEDNDPAGRTYASQILPESRLLGRLGKEFSAQVWVKSLRPGTTACILLDDGRDTTPACVEPSGAWQPLMVRHVVAENASYLRVVLAVGDRGQFSATGSFLADDVTLWDDSGPLPLANAGFEAAASPLMAWLGDLAARLQWPAGLWHGWLSAASYAPAHLRRYALYVALTFAHFWGDFGWLQLPLPIGWYVVLAAVSGLSVLGLIRNLTPLPPSPARRGGTAAPPSLAGKGVGGSGSGFTAGWLPLMFVAALFALAATYLPMIGQRWQPQGRYLFPALTPLVTLLIAGLRMWLPRRLSPRGQRIALTGWIVLLFALDQAALWGVLYRVYY